MKISAINPGTLRLVHNTYKNAIGGVGVMPQRPSYEKEALNKAVEVTISKEARALAGAAKESK